MEVKVKEMEKQGSNTWMDCQYLVEANEALHECRYALRYTCVLHSRTRTDPSPPEAAVPARRRYVYAFYLEKSGSHKHNFEMQQSELERQTEEVRQHESPAAPRLLLAHACASCASAQLAGLLERDVKDIERTEVVHCFQMAKKRLVNLFEIVDSRAMQGEGQSSGI